MPDSPRFSFHPLERRGVLLGLNAGQLVTMGSGVTTALALHGLIGGAPGTLASVLAIGGAVVLAVWTRQGQPLIAWAMVGVTWVHRRGGRVQLSEEPRAGNSGWGGRSPAPAAPPGRSPGPPTLRPGAGPLIRGVDVTETDDGPVGHRYGVIRDRQSGSWSAVVPVTGRSFSLLDSDQQLQALEAWRTVLAAVGRPDSPVIRLQWIRRSGPTPAGDPAVRGPLAVSATDVAAMSDPVRRAADSYRQLVEAVTPSAQSYDTWLALVVAGDRRRPGARPPDSLGRELRFLEGQLRQAGLGAGPALSAGDLHRLLGSGALAVREGWSALQVDGDWHATYWVAEWPRLGVGPDFLLPLLVGPGRRTVSVVASPVSTERALREVRSARTADLADAQLRNRAGFLSSARRDREAEGVVRREHELAEGHAEYRFSAYVSVAASDEPALGLACAELQQAAQAAHLELRRLYGRQAEALTWTLPVGRGLR